jgi:hypothetical protein
MSVCEGLCAEASGNSQLILAFFQLLALGGHTIKHAVQGLGQIFNSIGFQDQITHADAAGNSAENEPTLIK